MRILEVAVPGPFREGLDYLLDDTETQDAELIGRRVFVPLGKGQRVGVILKVKSQSAFERSRLKKINEIIDAEPLFSPSLQQLIHWVSQYYHHPIGEAYQTAMNTAMAHGLPIEPDVEATWALTTAGENIDPDSLKRSPAQRSALQQLRQFGKLDRSCFEKANISSNTLKTLEEKGWIARFNQPLTLPDNTPTDLQKELNPEQLSALNALLKAGNQFQVHLLEGVTGSGKTEVYLQRIAPLIEAGKQVLILVPEIGLTPQTIERFTSRFKAPVIALHSSLNEREKKLATFYAKTGKAKIIIGTRSAVFIPTHTLGMIIIDEEHDLSFKQQSGLRYHGRDVAIKRAQLENIPILLGSATPSLESLHHAMTQKYHSLKLQQRAGKGALPKAHLINLRQQPLTGGLSRPLIQACEKHLKAGGQVLIFINRRGYSPVLMCHDCGWMAICPRCDRYFTLHQKPPRLSCHHCESQRPIPSTCPECKSDHALIDVGVGTEKVEAALKALFPTYNVLRIDRSSVTKKGEMHECLTQIHNGDADILVGTQMLAKGHHFSRLRMVGILGVDDSLFSNDFHATERLGQLILQVAGRAGRDDSDGEVFIQTHHTDHPLLNILLQQGYGPFAQHLLAEREAAHWPPFSYLALIRAEAHEFSKSFEALNTLKEHLKTLNLPHLNILGPLPAFLAKRAGLFRAQLILQADDRKTLHQALFQLDDWLNHHATRQVRISLDIDPKEMG